MSEPTENSSGSGEELILDDAAVVWSEPQSELGNRPLVVLMHGRGSHEHDLMSLVPMLPAEAVYASVRAPLSFEGGGFTWFPLGRPGDPEQAIADAATQAVLCWLDTVGAAGPISVAGFSQGGVLATHLLRWAPERFASFVNLAGFIVAGQAPADARLGDLKPPVFWGRGQDDQVIPPAAFDRTAAWLPAHSTLTSRSYPGVAHSISREEIDDVSDFLAATLLQGQATEKPAAT